MTPSNPQRIARLTGGAYLGIIVCGIFAEFIVRMSLVDRSDAAATATHIARSAALFRAGIIADLLMIALDIGVSVGFYELLKHVHRPLARLAAAFRLIQAAVLAANLMNLASALRWATTDTASAAMASGTPQALVLASMEAHRVTYDLGLVYFGLACLVLGHLLRVSRLVPAILGIGLSLAGVVYLVGSLCVVLAFDIAASLDVMYGLALAAELAVASRLLTKGVSSAESQRIPAVVGVALLLSAYGGGWSVFAPDGAGCAVAVQNAQRCLVLVRQGAQI